MVLKAGIIVFPGTNCEYDTARACEFFGWEVNFIRHDEQVGKGCDVIFLPGGFSYGDHISSGRIAKLSKAVKSLPTGKTLIIGICNGFQILCEAGFLPGALTCNEGLNFISKVVPLEFQGELIHLPIAHHQGNYIGAGPVFMRYTSNINGSDDFTAGIYDRQNKIMAMMPHPERAVHAQLDLTDGRKVFKFIEQNI